MEKIRFEEPRMEVIRFHAQEIVTATSGGDSTMFGVEQPTREKVSNSDALL